MKGQEQNRNREPESTPEAPVEPRCRFQQPRTREPGTCQTEPPSVCTLPCKGRRAPEYSCCCCFFRPKRAKSCTPASFCEGDCFKPQSAKSCTPARSSPCMHEKEVNRDSPIKKTATGPRAHEPEKGRRKAPRTSQGVLNSSMHVQYPAQVT